MKTNNKQKKQTGLSRTINALLLTGLVATTAQAGMIVSEESAPSVPPNPGGFVADGFGGWNLENNVEIVLHGTQGAIGTEYSWFDESDGSYNFAVDSDLTYQGNVYDDTSIIMGHVLAKDWPVGEPSGIKIVNDDYDVKMPKPQNCIMATSYLADHFLDSTDPKQVPCSGPFQSHKRYKLAMLPTTVIGGAGSEKGIDLVFNVVDDGGSRDYQVFQKINNWTDGRLEGFTIQVGFGIGSAFTPASTTSGVGVANLSLSVPAEIWRDNQLANFSAGLFGPADPHHDRNAGFFDPMDPAGFFIAEYPNLSGETDTLTSKGTLESDYAEVPAGATNQFGPWLADSMLPYGIFWDDDGNPETDAELLAWYGCNPTLPEVDSSCALGWMTGAADGFAEVPEDTITGWGENLEFTQGVIDDLVNVGLNYVVTIGDVTNFTNDTFTIRITPKAESVTTPPPPYVVDGETVPPVPSLEFLSSDGVVAISPSPEFVTGSLLTARVGDADLNLDPDVVNYATVYISAAGPGDFIIPKEELQLVEQGENRGVFAATLPDEFSNVPVDTVVTVLYIDAYDGNVGVNIEKTVTTTAVEELTPPPPVPDVSITELTVPASLFVGQTRKLSLTAKNDKEAEAHATGDVTITGTYQVTGVNVVIDPDEPQEITDLAPNKKARFSYLWTATEEGVVDWTATVNIDGVDPVTAFATTVVSVKPGNSKK